MARYDAADLLWRLKRRLQRPLDDETLTDPTAYQLLTDAQEEVLSRIATYVPRVVFGAPLALPAGSEPRTYVFPTLPFGHAEVFRNKRDAQRTDWAGYGLTPGVDFTQEGLLLRFPDVGGAVLSSTGPWVRFVAMPPAISDLSEPTIQPPDARRMVVELAAATWAEETGLRDPEVFRAEAERLWLGNGIGDVGILGRLKTGMAADAGVAGLGPRRARSEDLGVDLNANPAETILEIMIPGPGGDGAPDELLSVDAPVVSLALAPLAPPPPTTPAGEALALTAYRDPRVGAGVQADRSKNGVPLPRTAGAGRPTFTEADVSSIGVFVDGVEVPAYLGVHVRPRADGTLRMVWLEYEPGPLAPGATKATVELRKNARTLTRLTKQGNTFTRNLTGGLYANGVMPCYSFPSQSVLVDSQFMDGFRIPTAAEVGALPDVRLASTYTRMAGELEPYWTTGATFPGTAVQLGNDNFGRPLVADKLTTAFYTEDGNDYYGLRENACVIRGGQYEQATGLRHLWIATGDMLAFRRCCAQAWFYQREWLRRRIDADGQVTSPPYQGPDSAFWSYAVMGEATAGLTVREFAERFYDNAFYDGIGYNNWGMIGNWDPAFTAGSGGQWHRRGDNRIDHRGLWWLRRAHDLYDAAEKDRDHHGNARDWASLYHQGRLKLTVLDNPAGTGLQRRALRAAPAPFDTLGLVLPDGTGCLSYESLYLNTWQAADLMRELEEGLTFIPASSSDAAALHGVVDGVMRYLLLGPRYIDSTFNAAQKVIAVHQSDDCGISTDGDTLNTFYGFAGYTAAARVGGTDGATMLTRTDRLMRDALRGDAVTTPSDMQYSPFGKAWNEVFANIVRALGKKIHG